MKRSSNRCEEQSDGKKKPKLFETFTKTWVSILLMVAIIDLQLSYFLAYAGRDQIAETLSVAVVTEIIGVAAIYIIRSHFDTKSEKQQDLAERRFQYETESDCGETEPDDDTSLG